MNLDQTVLHIEKNLPTEWTWLVRGRIPSDDTAGIKGNYFAHVHIPNETTHLNLWSMGDNPAEALMLSYQKVLIHLGGN